MNRSLAALLALAATACSFAPEYKRPETVTPAEYRFAQPGEATSVADLPWWQVFKDPVLQDLIRVALANNQDLALAAARVDESRAFVGIAKADLYPQVSAQIDAAYGRPISRNLNPGASNSGNYSGTANLSWELDLWGRVRNSRDAALADLLATEDFRRAIILALVSGVAQAYLELRELDLELQISQSNTDTRRGTLDLFEARARRGIASDLEVSQARADLAVTMAAIPETELAIAQKEHQICVLLGRAPGPIPRGSALVDTPIPPQIPLGVPAQLLGRRPDVLAAEQTIIGSGKRVGVAVANRLPTLSLTAFIGLQGAGGATLFGSDGLAWNAGGGLFAPIFQGGRLASQEDAARAQLEQSVASYKKAVQVALQEVADAAAGVRKLREARVVRTDQVTASTRAAKLAVDRYQGGVSSYFEVLDAQRQLFSAQLDLARTQRDELTSFVLLYRSLGGGWQIEEGQPPPTTTTREVAATKINRGHMDTLRALKQVFIFKDVPDAVLELVARAAEEMSASPGETIVSHGQSPNALYVIRSGTVRLAPEGRDRSPAQFGSGETIGDVPFVDGGPAAVTAVALERAELLVIRRKKLDELFANKPEAAHQFYRAIAESLAKRLRRAVDMLAFATERDGKS